MLFIVNHVYIRVYMYLKHIQSSCNVEAVLPMYYRV
jgi:hypothetical protein